METLVCVRNDISLQAERTLPNAHTFLHLLEHKNRRSVSDWFKRAHILETSELNFRIVPFLAQGDFIPLIRRLTHRPSDAQLENSCDFRRESATLRGIFTF